MEALIEGVQHVDNEGHGVWSIDLVQFPEGVLELAEQTLLGNAMAERKFTMLNDAAALIRRDTLCLLCPRPIGLQASGVCVWPLARAGIPSTCRPAASSISFAPTAQRPTQCCSTGWLPPTRNTACSVPTRGSSDSLGTGYGLTANGVAALLKRQYVGCSPRRIGTGTMREACRLCDKI